MAHDFAPRMVQAHRRAAGFTLVEFMVAIVIGLLIITGLFAAFLSASWTTSTNARFAEVQNNGRFTIDYMRRELQHAGFLGLSGSGLPAQTGTPSTVDYGCGAGFIARIEQPIWGENDAKTLSCIPDADYARGDILVVRRAGLQPLSGSVVSDRLYIQSAFGLAAVYPGSAPPSTPSGSPTLEHYPLEVDDYYISPYTNDANESPQVPALYRRTLGAGPALSKQLIATGIENMQVQYGVATVAGTVFRNASDVTAAEWPNVTSARIWLLARSTDAEPGYSNTTSYTMGDKTVTASDGFARQAFPLVVGVRR